MSLEIIWENDGVIRRFYGNVTANDLVRSIEAIHTDIRFSALRFSINDFNAVTSIDVTKAVIANAALRTIGDSKSNDCILVAIVATDPQVLELTNFYASPSYLPYPAKTFATISEAREWISESAPT